MMVFETCHVGRRRLSFLGQLVLANFKSGPQKSYEAFLKFGLNDDLLAERDMATPTPFDQVHVKPVHVQHVDSVRRCALGPLTGAGAAILPSGGYGALDILDLEPLAKLFLAPVAPRITQGNPINGVLGAARRGGSGTPLRREFAANTLLRGVPKTEPP